MSVPVCRESLTTWHLRYVSRTVYHPPAIRHYVVIYQFSIFNRDTPNMGLNTRESKWKVHYQPRSPLDFPHWCELPDTEFKYMMKHCYKKYYTKNLPIIYNKSFSQDTSFTLDAFQFVKKTNENKNWRPEQSRKLVNIPTTLNGSLRIFETYNLETKEFHRK